MVILVIMIRLLPSTPSPARWFASRFPLLLQHYPCYLVTSISMLPRLFRIGLLALSNRFLRSLLRSIPIFRVKPLMFVLRILCLLIPVSLLVRCQTPPELRNDERDVLRVIDVETCEVTSVSSTRRIRFGRIGFGSTAVRSEEDEGVGGSLNMTRSCLASVRFRRFAVLADSSRLSVAGEG